mmetsp:Transcript_8930/g.36884  ORF Transcript_8930/g.36884 Transcript_8930/m.36884 type:complete len:227 (+) Transcript_8930:3127-3807(+)
MALTRFASSSRADSLARSSRRWSCSTAKFASVSAVRPTRAVMTPWSVSSMFACDATTKPWIDEAFASILSETAAWCVAARARSEVVSFSRVSIFVASDEILESAASPFSSTAAIFWVTASTFAATVSVFAMRASRSTVAFSWDSSALIEVSSACFDKLIASPRDSFICWRSLLVSWLLVPSAMVLSSDERWRSVVLRWSSVECATWWFLGERCSGSASRAVVQDAR